jgi:hypothetical protein
MFHATARALSSAASKREEDGIGPIPIDPDLAALAATFDGSAEGPTRMWTELELDGPALRVRHDELRWAESKLMHAAERLAEAQEARRKDLVALAIMRRELRASFAAERTYLKMQRTAFSTALPLLAGHEKELAALVEGGATTADVIGELASVRTERKLYALAISQVDAQLARIDDSEASLDHDVENEAYGPDPDGETLKEIARLKALQVRSRRAASAARASARATLEELGLDTSLGEITAVASFLASELEGDERGTERMERLRAYQMQRELGKLPIPTSGWKTGLLHPVRFVRSKRRDSLVAAD